ncbi:hypothetical protein I3843_16G079900 [Carya illinoinensis]|nr:hypothetical protein I3843_16G079900 [Carya illinoinensis]
MLQISSSCRILSVLKEDHFKHKQQWLRCCSRRPHFC